MAVALDTSAKFSNSGSTTVGGAYTCTGTNLVLVAYTLDAVGDGTNTTGVTYNGVAMTQVRLTTTNGGDATIGCWVLPGPATGSNTLTASRTTGTASFTILAESLTGCDQTAGTGCLDTDSGGGLKYVQGDVGGASTSNSTTFGISTTGSYALLGSWSGRSGLAASTGATVRAGGVQTGIKGQDSDVSGCVGIFDSNGTLDIGNYQMVTTFTGGRGTQIQIAVKEGGAAPAEVINRGFTLIGVGR